MNKYHFSIILLILAACMSQQFSPAIAALFGARVLILPLVFLCCCVCVDFASMLLLAFICGFLWDAQHTLGAQGGDPAIYADPVESLRFGYSVILYAMMGLFMQFIQPLFRKAKWHTSSILAGVGIFSYLFAEYLLLNFVRGDFSFPPSVLYRIYLSSALTMLFSPLIFWIISQLASSYHYNIRYEGLRQKHRYID
jgi:cell shape-determining protein MreD